jgi:indolepyruvate ferredoxin oxidoreductase
MAAHIEGKGCATLNQTGLAQKFGAVVSHVRVAEDQPSIKAVRVPAGEADLLIGCDLVVSTGYDTMGKTAENRTHAIINDAEQPTAAFIHDPDAELPTAAMRHHIQQQCGSDSVTFVNATNIALQVLGDSLYLNLFLLGIAHQQGKVPVTAEALNEAINLNGVEVAGNQRAFLMGRRFAAWPEKVLALMPDASAPMITQVDEPLELDALITERTQRLVAYQSQRFAQAYQQQVDLIRQQDPIADQPGSVTRVVAEQLYRLMAIKDEYEVARLFTSDAFRAQLDDQFEPGYRLHFHLAPPIFSRIDSLTGRSQKRVFGGWMLTAFRLLKSLRWLRNTPLDIFSLTAERRSAKTDLSTYRQDLAVIAQSLSTCRYDDALALAGLPEKLRGYGPVRETARAVLTPQRSTLRGKLDSLQAVQIASA